MVQEFKLGGLNIPFVGSPISFSRCPRLSSPCLVEIVVCLADSPFPILVLPVIEKEYRGIKTKKIIYGDAS